MRTRLNLTDEELIQRMKDALEISRYLIDPEDLEEVLKRFEANLAITYQAEQVLDAST